jgi:plastocyanin
MTRAPRTTFVLSAAFALTLLAAACGGDGTDADAGDDGGTGPTGSPSASEPTPTPTGDEGEDEDGTTLNAGNFFFQPRSFEVASGTELLVDNRSSSTPHTFTVKGTEIDLELSPGDSEDVTIDLDPGEYDFVCRFHAMMTGTLTVT